MFNHIFRKIIKTLLLISFAFSQLDLSGVVFHDKNKDGIQNLREEGIKGIPVSNGKNIVLTDRQGKFQIKSDSNDVIFIMQPSGWQVPVNEYNIPQYYINIRLKKWPEFLKYDGFTDPLPLPEQIMFPLYKSKVNGHNFRAIISGDPQPRDSAEVRYFRDEILNSMLIQENPEFYVPLGDIMYDDLSLFPYYLEQVSELGIPIWHVFGNHDINYKAPSDSLAKETWRLYFGPDYFSFEYGNVHFIALNTVYYKGWNKEKNKKGRYVGKLHNDQLIWLKNDLSLVSSGKQIVFLSHIPIISDVYKGESVELTNRDQLYKMIHNRKKVLALCGHMHYLENMELTMAHGWTGKAEFRNLNLGAGCGAWWYGPIQANGVPYGFHYDGTPNGYFMFDFSKTNFNYEFIPSKSDPSQTFRISHPMDRLKTESIDTSQIAINVYFGGPKTIVSCMIDDKEVLLRKAVTAEDPYMNQLILMHPDLYPSIDKMPVNAHMWLGDFPILNKGNHTIRIQVNHDNGITENQAKIFEIY
ncbi:MAG: calcineurin-like phosphoesterase C-terminal domain-containing protein [Candidatus Marinimicrobia bacterium]|nr:calcineurin-like phosphoesterase C-terminal domain-containing protein [Candidatus Neomarinimicrobiota bacterium]MBL7030748.1 calcineurin-like phosphoesterase C-terminal domain-containing protein [Candidatus Neomarinimicrobiota bacterium]